MAHRGLDPDLGATPTMMNVLNPQIAEGHVSGVPSNADIAKLVEDSSEGSGAISGISWKPGESRRNQGRTSSGEATVARPSPCAAGMLQQLLRQRHCGA